MTNKWTAFLKEKTKQDQTIAAKELALSDLSNQGIIKVSGEDAESFLQNQLSNDITKLTENSYQLSAWCSPKGRIIASFKIFKQADSFILILAADLLEHIIKKLSIYVMMAKVSIENITESTVHFGLSGDFAIPEVEMIIGDTLTETDSNLVLTHQSFRILQINGLHPRFEFFAEIPQGIEEADYLWNKLSTSATVCNHKQWDYLDILAGIPHISQASSEAWIPQMVNYIAVGGVDFKKGCYPGQEVVARLNYLGKTKRRMYHLKIETTELPEIGAVVSSDSEKDAGKILSSVLSPAGTIEALAILKIAEADSILTLSDTQSSIEILELPYALDDA